MEQLVKRFIKENLISIDKPIVCAVSGGADSVALLNILHNLGYEIVLAHVNHHKRIESELEQKAMEEAAKKLEIPFELLEYHYDGNDNFHNDSHHARYKFFKEVCEKYNTNIIATAHHLDDQLETILIKLLEGSNLYGYGGISVCNDDGSYKIIRPLLCVSKVQIYEYLNKKSIEYFEDSSNKEDIYLRNRIRHKVVPLLKQESEALYEKVYEYSIQLKEAFSYIRNQSIDYLNKTNNIIELKTFNGLDIALKKDIISLLFERNNINKNYDIINNVVEFLSDENGSKSIDLSGCRLIKSYDLAYIKTEVNQIPEEVCLNLDNDIIYNDKYHIYFSNSIPKNNEKYIKLCYNDIRFPLIVRAVREGDFIEALVGRKKINRVFIDKKVPKEDRVNVPIITDNDNNILWVFDYIKSKNVYEQKEKGKIYLVCKER